ncbi:MAG: ComF family protein [Candidatus Omnitrophica bacterium]|nr:ComF family protein [Candidatus Omnitrophota bacterium]
MSFSLSHLYTGFLDLIFPRLCIDCKKNLSSHNLFTEDDFQLCLSCQTKIIENIPPFCERCPFPLEPQKESKILCSYCQHYLPHFDRAWSAAVYDDQIRDLIHLFKYHSKTALRHFFTHLLTNAIETYGLPARHCDLIIPIPLHPTRRRERGYNQAELLVRELSLQLNIPSHLHNLQRIRNTHPQSLLKPKERWTNIHGAFKIASPWEMKDKNILLVDDLYTTGATLSEAAATLKQAGAQKVFAITVAVALS